MARKPRTEPRTEPEPVAYSGPHFGGARAAARRMARAKRNEAAEWALAQQMAARPRGYGKKRALVARSPKALRVAPLPMAPRTSKLGKAQRVLRDPKAGMEAVQRAAKIVQRAAR